MREISRAWSCLHALYACLSMEKSLPKNDFLSFLFYSFSFRTSGSVIIKKTRTAQTSYRKAGKANATTLLSNDSVSVYNPPTDMRLPIVMPIV